jgi:hypothetical protein
MVDVLYYTVMQVLDFFLRSALDILVVNESARYLCIEIDFVEQSRKYKDECVIVSSRSPFHIGERKHYWWGRYRHKRNSGYFKVRIFLDGALVRERVFYRTEKWVISDDVLAQGNGSMGVSVILQPLLRAKSYKTRCKELFFKRKFRDARLIPSPQKLL